MLKHRYEPDAFVGAKPPGNIERCSRCGQKRMLVQPIDPFAATPLGATIHLFRGAREGGWSTHNPRCAAAPNGGADGR